MKGIYFIGFKLKLRMINIFIKGLSSMHCFIKIALLHRSLVFDAFYSQDVI